MKSQKWEDLEVPLSKPILETLKVQNFQTMTPVQTACIPLLLKGKDVAAEAVTGSGKTLAFLIPMLEMLQRREDGWKKLEIGSIIVSPTRELATQINEVLANFLIRIPTLKQVLLVGGTTVDEDVIKLKNGANIIVATPGRLEDILSNCKDINLASSVKALELLVLDEADRLLDLGFTATINTILSYLPRLRRTGLFSATQTKELQQLIRAGLRNPVVVSVKEKASTSTPSMLINSCVIVTAENKLATMYNFIKKKGTDLKYMIFFSTCACVDYFSHVLKMLFQSSNIFALHGKMKDKRYKIFEQFRSSDNGLLLCTDVMARGVDIPEVDWVLQYDPPSNASSFVHRCGRTARIGNEGNALLFLLESEDAYIDFIRRNQKVDLNKIELEQPTSVVKCLKVMRSIQQSDRLIFDKANRAFVSYIQAYQKHECSLILRLKDLNLGKVAMGFGLLKMPRMPELKKQDTSLFQDPAVDVNSIAYKDKQRESKRLEKLKVFRQTGIWPTKNKRPAKQTEPWSETKKKKLDTKDKRNKRKEKKALTGPVKKKRKKVCQEDIEELAKDIALMKKLKKKKISQEQFDSAFGVN
ncbi:probable ATP-dependent RNA helicase DDX55 homolog [Neodiprion fabricii]|uniref:probable ATP-dependent RNA helicase DDX55 homolog n=1 Tax=Neodiprion fabricii TaxID=2872261 RepID=UPI001ED9102A|nr:probable ATP-dependent RNA helicase DDX55 homolog [Neodiprion fabricii]